MLAILVITIVTLIYFYVYFKNRRIYAVGDKFPGPKAYPLLGNSLDFATTSNGIFSRFVEFGLKYGRFFRIWNNGKLYVICQTFQDAEVVMSSNKHLKKTDLYKFFYPWIGEGLISTSDIPTWRKHRKIITPTFHFTFLHSFLDIFNKNALILCEQLAEKADKDPFDVFGYVKLAALDNICETAMGVNVNAQKNSTGEYVKAVKTITNVITMRMFKVWLMSDFLFNLSKYSKIQKEALRVLHGTTRRVIQERLQQLKQKKDSPEKFDEATSEKKKLAFLDLLLESEEGSQLSDKELQEEVDTFMFAGHDTISTAISFNLYCLSLNPEVQENVYKEQKEIFGESDRSPTYSDIQEMKYLEMVIKETGRVYPSVPMVGRELYEDLYLPGNFCVPKGSQIVINIFNLHKDPKVWENPNNYNPDNFLPEAIQSRNPYTYVPFSAGPRNCLGQKYAILAMKATLSTLLRRYKILPSPNPKHEPLLANEVVLVSVNGIHVAITSRI